MGHSDDPQDSASDKKIKKLILLTATDPTNSLIFFKKYLDFSVSFSKNLLVDAITFTAKDSSKYTIQCSGQNKLSASFEKSNKRYTLTIGVEQNTILIEETKSHHQTIYIGQEAMNGIKALYEKHMPMMETERQRHIQQALKDHSSKETYEGSYGTPSYQQMIVSPKGNNEAQQPSKQSKMKKVATASTKVQGIKKNKFFSFGVKRKANAFQVKKDGYQR